MDRRAGTGQAQQEEGPAVAMRAAAVDPSRQFRVQEWIWIFPQSISPARIRSRVYEFMPGLLEGGASC